MKTYSIPQSALSNPYQTKWALLGSNGDGPAAQGVVEMSLGDGSFLSVAVARGMNGTDGSVYAEDGFIYIVDEATNSILEELGASQIQFVEG